MPRRFAVSYAPGVANRPRSGGMTTNSHTGSGILWPAIASVISLACGTPSNAEPTPGSAAPTPNISKEPAVAGESCLGVADKGIWSDLDDKVQLALPAKLDKQRVPARVDAAHKLLVLSIDGFPRKVYPLTGAAVLEV